MPHSIIHLWHLHPPVGVYIAILALLGVIVPLVREKVGPREKAVWTIVMFALLLLEIHSIYEDRAEHESEQAAARAEQLKSFSKIAKGIDTTIVNAQQQFGATMKRSNQLLGVERESLDNITGGDSYTYVAVGIGLQPPFQLDVWVKGKHGVHDVTAEIQQFFGTDPASIKKQIDSMHSLPLGTGEFLPGITAIGDQYIQPGRYFLRVLTRNSDISEQLDIAQCSDGQWSEAIKMNGPGAKENKSWQGIHGCHKPFN